MKPKDSETEGFSLFGIKFAPLRIPIARRLQTLSVMFWFWIMVPNGIVESCTLVYMLLYTKYWWISAAYFTWMIVDINTPEKGGRSDIVKNWFQRWSIWKYYVDYFPMTLVKTAELDPEKNYIFGSHPHGILCSGLFGALAVNGLNKLEVFKNHKIHFHTVSYNFKTPFRREWSLALGGVSANKESVTHLMNKQGGGNVSVIIVGGASESLLTTKEEVTLVLKNRKGFVKIALKTGAQLVPTFSFGEAHIYDVVSLSNPFFRNFQEKSRQFLGFAPVIFLGRGVFQYSMGLLPHRKPVQVVIGEPIPVVKNTNPSDEEIEGLHSKYVASLQQLYKKYSRKYGYTDIKLKII